MPEPIVKRADAKTTLYREDYGVDRFGDKLHHFVVWTTTPTNPFGPHQHAGSEFWFILEGEALAILDGNEHPVKAGDFIYLEPNHSHGLRTATQVRWICMG